MSQQCFVHSKQHKAVVLADKGRSLFPLVGESHSKALLPIDNRPMVYYPLRWLVSNGVTEIFVFADIKEKARIKKYIGNTFLEQTLEAQETHKDSEQNRIKIEVIACEEDVSFADKLGIVSETTEGTLLVVPCDLVTDYPISSIIQKQMETGNDIVVLLSAKDQTSLCVGLDRKENVLLIERSIDPDLVFDQLILKKHRQIRFYRNLETTEIALFSNKALEFVRSKQFCFFTCEETIAALIQMKMEGQLNIQNSGLMETTFMTENMLNSVYNFKHTAKTLVQDTICSAIVLKETDFIRANTVASYLEANLKLAGNGKSSVIGENTKIGQNTKLTRCVIMDGAVIEDNVKLKEVVVGVKARICKGSRLYNCEVGSFCVVEANQSAQNESFCV